MRPPRAAGISDLPRAVKKQAAAAACFSFAPAALYRIVPRVPDVKFHLLITYEKYGIIGRKSMK